MTTVADLEDLDRAVERALATLDETGLHVLGYGEISSVVAWPEPTGPWACKRLPVFADEAHLRAYRWCFDEYLRALSARGVRVHDSRLEALPRDNGEFIAYCVQPVIPPATLAPEILRNATPSEGADLLTSIFQQVTRAVDPVLGLDAQLSNWAVLDGEVVYLDVTTPLLRDEHGRELLDTELFVASLPAALRPVVRRFLLSGIVDTYYSYRPIALDLVGNLHKERLGEWVPTAIELAHEHLGVDLDVDEVRRYYRSDARLWSMLQRLRRIDRVWQRTIRRRPYPNLLPGPVERHP
jgi:hypothetical protein